MTCAPTRLARIVFLITIGGVYVVSSEDPGEDGPIRSVVSKIGSVTSTGPGDPIVQPSQLQRLAVIDGVKAESLALRPSGRTAPEVFFGTDDEHYGGLLRLLPLPGAIVAGMMAALRISVLLDLVDDEPGEPQR